MPYCPNCGQEVEEADRFCIQCGTTLEGRAGGGSHRAHDTDAPPGTMSPRGPGTAEFSTATLWGPVVVAALGVVQSLYFVLAPDQILAAAGFGEEFTTDVIIATGVLGLLMAFSVLGLVYYYWNRGHVDRRYFWALVGLGVAGFFLGGGIAFLALVVIGAYGLLSVL
jgi:hypothetical protein